ncbi:hypothetical protein BH09GEM1_BH09GEM1_42450 [soil metagenome]
MHKNRHVVLGKHYVWFARQVLAVQAKPKPG